MVVRFLTQVGRLFSSERQRQFNQAVSLYDAIVTQSRQPVFYTDLAVPDELDGRFDLLTVHAGLVMRRLGRGGESGAKMAQTLFDVMFLNMDDSLREMGVGDLKIGNKVRELAEGFYGRLGAYEAALSKEEEGARFEALRAALARNVYGQDPHHVRSVALTAYVLKLVEELDAQPIEALMAGQVTFPAAPPLDLADETEKAPAP